MYWLEGSQDQFVPQTPPIFQNISPKSSQFSPSATVPDISEFASSQESQGSQDANVPGTPVIQTTIPNFNTPTTPVTFNRKSRYGTPLLEIVLLKSARKHAQEKSLSTAVTNSIPNSPQLEQTVPSTPKENKPNRISMLKEQSPIRLQVKKKCQNLDLFAGDEIFPK